MAPVRVTGPSTKRDVAAREVDQDLRDRGRGEEAQVGRTRQRMPRLGLERVIRLVQVDLLRPEVQGVAPLGLDMLQAEHRLVEHAGALDIRDREDQVVQAVDLHASLMAR